MLSLLIEESAKKLISFSNSFNKNSGIESHLADLSHVPAGAKRGVGSIHLSEEQGWFGTRSMYIVFHIQFFISGEY